MAYNFKNTFVLVAEDDPTMRLLMGNIFKVLNVKECILEKNGQEAFNTFKARKPDIVISDWHMDLVDGIELTALIREYDREHNSLTPIILMSGHAEERFIISARDAGVSEFLLKPFSVNDMANRIAYALAKPKKLINSMRYYGPDRRFRVLENYQGPFRRQGEG